MEQRILSPVHVILLSVDIERLHGEARKSLVSLGKYKNNRANI